MREGKKGWKYIDDMMGRFEEKHDLHMSVYGEGNSARMLGSHETAAYDEFSYGVGNRAASFRIPTEVANAGGKGYIEDRRPGSNIDPYLVAALVFDTGVVDGLVDDKTAA
jgi:glutamine synthetase